MENTDAIPQVTPPILRQLPSASVGILGCRSLDAKESFEQLRNYKHFTSWNEEEETLRTSWKSGLGPSPAGLASWAKIQNTKENSSPRQPWHGGV